MVMLSRAPNVDYEVRWGIIKLADLVLRGVEEAPPKVTIHLPPTPVLEQPPPIKLPPRATARPIKTGGPPMRNPLVSTSAPPKLKIVPSGSQARASSVATPVTGAARMPPPPPPAAKAKAKPKARPPTANGVKAPQIPKAQSSGMSVNDLRACRNALKKLKLNKNALLFMQSVDPVRDHAPK